MLAGSGAMRRFAGYLQERLSIFFCPTSYYKSLGKELSISFLLNIEIGTRESFLGDYANSIIDR